MDARLKHIGNVSAVSLLFTMCNILLRLSIGLAEEVRNMKTAYEQKITFSENKTIVFKDFELTFLGTRTVPVSEYARGKFIYYDFRITQGEENKTISWSSGTGDIAPLRFSVGKKSFYLELRMSDRFGAIANNELIVTGGGSDIKRIEIIKSAIFRSKDKYFARAEIEAIMKSAEVLFDETFSSTRDEWQIKIDPSVDANIFCEAMGWEKPYAVNTTVHQSDLNWAIDIWVRNLSDKYNPRIATEIPKVGSWQVAAYLEGRPKGELPKIMAGASPGYDLTKYKSNVVRLRMSKEK